MGLFFQHGKAGFQDGGIAPEFVDDQTLDACPLGGFQQFHRAVYQSVDVVVAGLGVLNKVQDILLCLLRGRDGFSLLERSVTRLGDSRQILFLDTGSRVFQSLKACEFRGVVCHLIAPLNGLCR